MCVLMVCRIGRADLPAGVSCPKFDLCRTCKCSSQRSLCYRSSVDVTGYTEVEEIHPSHAFLSLPKNPVQIAGPSRPRVQPNGVSVPAIRHHGVFCHKYDAIQRCCLIVADDGQAACKTSSDLAFIALYVLLGACPIFRGQIQH